MTVNCIAPGPFPSRSDHPLHSFMCTDDYCVVMRGTLKVMGDEIAEGTALGRLGRPADMAAAALFLASPAGSFLTGTEFAVDGGSLVSRSAL